MRLGDFSVLSLDCYGTLIDWEAGLLAGLRPLASRLENALADETILTAFAHHESVQQRATPTKPYREILAVVYKRLAEVWGRPAAWDECLRFGNSIADWPAFSDSAEALVYLKRHFRLVVLSNIDNASFAASQAKLGMTFDAVYTAEDIGTYRLDRRCFEFMLARLGERGVAPTDVLHTAQSLYHDHVVAAEVGLARCWIDRREGQAGSGATPASASFPEPHFCFASLSDLVEAHRAEK